MLKQIVPGVTERQVARWIDDELRDRSEGPGFDTIVASGPNGAIPHHQPTDRVIERGDLVTMDFGASRRRLPRRHDANRVRGHPAGWLAGGDLPCRAGAQAAGVAALDVGRAAVEVDAAAREVIEAAGFGSYFVHGLGHGVGLQIHEAPYLGMTSHR